MGRLRANFARLGNPMQDCHLGKEPALRISRSPSDTNVPSGKGMADFLTAFPAP